MVRLKMNDSSQMLWEHSFHERSILICFHYLIFILLNFLMKIFHFFVFNSFFKDLHQFPHNYFLLPTSPFMLTAQIARSVSNWFTSLLNQPTSKHCLYRIYIYVCEGAEWFLFYLFYFLSCSIVYSYLIFDLENGRCYMHFCVLSWERDRLIVAEPHCNYYHYLLISKLFNNLQHYFLVCSSTTNFLHSLHFYSLLIFFAMIMSYLKTHLYSLVLLIKHLPYYFLIRLIKC